jgi:hypothetical protein
MSIRSIAASALMLFACNAALAQERCTLIGTYQDSREKKASAFSTSDGLVTFQADVDVNTDGALQSYKADDLGFFEKGADGRFRLQTRSALNTICNGASIRRANHSLLFDFTQCGALIKEFQRIRDFGWLRNGENYVDFYAIALVPGTKSPAPARNRGKPCEKDGFYVSQVARAMDSSKSVCDPDHWVDALRIPAIVLPFDARMKAKGVQLHDLAIVRGTDGKWVGAIVGDTNPAKIGEATVITHMRLKGETQPPANYRSVLKLKIASAQYVVFPGTRALIPNLSNASDPDIQVKAKELFEKFDLGKRKRLCT